MKKDKITTKSDAELKKDFQGLKKKLREIRFNVSGSKVKNVKEANAIRKNIARILTEVKKRSLVVNTEEK